MVADRNYGVNEKQKQRMGFDDGTSRYFVSLSAWFGITFVVVRVWHIITLNCILPADSFLDWSILDWSTESLRRCWSFPMSVNTWCEHLNLFVALFNASNAGRFWLWMSWVSRQRSRDRAICSFQTSTPSVINCTSQSAGIPYDASCCRLTTSVCIDSTFVRESSLHKYKYQLLLSSSVHRADNT